MSDVGKKTTLADHEFEHGDLIYVSLKSHLAKERVPLGALDDNKLKFKLSNRKGKPKNREKRGLQHVKAKEESEKKKTKANFRDWMDDSWCTCRGRSTLFKKKREALNVLGLKSTASRDRTLKSIAILLLMTLMPKLASYITLSE